MAYDPLAIDAGQLRHQITITVPNAGERNSFGQTTPSESTTVLTTWAKIESTTGAAYKQLIQSGVISSQTTHLITMRWPGSSVQIGPNMNVVFGDQTYLVQGVDNVLQRNRVVRLFCQVIDGEVN
jgi:head-tail adaptor